MAIDYALPSPGPMTPPSSAAVIPITAAPSTRGVSVGGIMQIVGNRVLEERERQRVDVMQARPVIQGLASHVRKCWDEARQAKEQTVEPRMLQSLRQRRAEYDPDKLALIRSHGGGSEIYMRLTSAKCRGGSAWIRDAMLGAGADKPFSCSPTPMPSLPPEAVLELKQRAIEELAAYYRATGQQLEGAELREYLTNQREEMLTKAYEEARAGVQILERKMEDQLEEGGFRQALSEFIDDLVTFPSAIICGPIVRKKPKLAWVKDPATGEYTADVQEQITLEWERRDPFMIYPAPGASDVNDGYLIDRHRMRPHKLEELIGVPGYDDEAIRAALAEYQTGGLNNWLFVDTEKALAEGKSTTHIQGSTADPIIDVLQYWGHVSGKMLVDWGVPEAQVPHSTKQYACEVWLVGRFVIKAALNPDRLSRKPYYMTSVEKIPGAFWGNSIPDLIRDDQDMCNSSARAIANNMAIASGPQVGVNTERLPNGYNLTEMYPWKIHQFTSDPMGSTADALTFFQPQSIVQELMMVFEKFSVQADEHSNIPRYMTGDSPAGGAGRTASGFSMLQNNAMKGLKQVLSNMDIDIVEPAVNRLHYTNMRSTMIESWMKRGDLQVKARGASSILAKESLQIRRNEFLQATANPVDLQILGPEGRGAVLREQAKTLDMDTDMVVPNPSKLKMMRKAMAAMQEQAGAPEDTVGSGEQLSNGAPVTDDFSPS